MNVVASPLTALTGVTVITGVMFKRPVFEGARGPVLELMSWSVQTPGIHRAGAAGFCMSTVLPFRAESWPVGLEMVR